MHFLDEVCSGCKMFTCSKGDWTNAYKWLLSHQVLLNWVSNSWTWRMYCMCLYCFYASIDAWLCVLFHMSHQHLPEMQIFPPSTNPTVETEPGKTTFLDMKYLPYQVDTEFPCKIGPQFQGRIWTQVARVRTTSYLWDRTSDNHAREDRKHSPTQMMQPKFLYLMKFQISAYLKRKDWTLLGKITILILESPFTAQSRT